MRDGPRCFDQGSSCPGLLRVPDIPDMVARRGLSPSPAPLSSGVPLPITRESLRPYYPGPASTDPVWAPPRSIATTWGITVVFFSSRYLDVSVRGVGSPCGATALHTAGLPHSETPGSQDICSSPGIIAACHVLLRLREPRHPPYALIYFLPQSNFVLARPPNRRSSYRIILSILP